MRQCSLCSKQANRAHSRSHSNEASLKRQHANLVNKTMDGVRALVCTSCLRTKVKKSS